MASLQWPKPKDPAEDLDYILDWNDDNWLGSDKIISSVWDIPVELTSTGDSFNDNVTTIWLSGGDDGKTYTLTNTILTLGERTAQRDVKLKVKNK